MKRIFDANDETVTAVHKQLADLATAQPAFVLTPTQPLTKELLADLVESAFWASLRSDEGRTTRVFITVADPASISDSLRFDTPSEYSESQIAKLGHAAPRGGCLLVSVVNGTLRIWGCRATVILTPSRH